jgi:hypothetical protein
MGVRDKEAATVMDEIQVQTFGSMQNKMFHVFALNEQNGSLMLIAPNENYYL